MIQTETDHVQDMCVEGFRRDMVQCPAFALSISLTLKKRVKEDVGEARVENFDDR